MKAVVLHSGGIDSSALLSFVAKNDKPEKILALSFRYGSLHEDRESRAAEEVVAWYKKFTYKDGPEIERRVVKLDPAIFRGGDSALLGESKMPSAEYQKVEQEGPSATVVPFRNGTFISIASAIAQALGYDRVYAGMHADDARNWAYPDCHPKFVEAMGEAVAIATMQKVTLYAPFNLLTKAQIVGVAHGLHVPARLTYSCYKGDPEPCGVCPTCRDRVQAFMTVGYIDPTLPKDQIEDLKSRGYEVWRT
jgi:7-cyano-7-deazaguanine synthase